MFKKVVQFQAVAHRMGGNHAKKDPLDDEKVGSGKRSKASDGSDMIHYKETAEEQKARRRADRGGEKKRVEAPTLQLGPTPPAKSRKLGSSAGPAMNSFKDKLKASTLADDAARAEQRHKDELAAEKEKALAKYKAAPAGESTSVGSSSSTAAAAAAANCPDNDERLSFNDIWKEGEEESTSDWLNGGGLKFHTTADKAFSLESKRFKEMDSGNAAQNREAAADQEKKQAEMRMREFKRGQR